MKTLLLTLFLSVPLLLSAQKKEVLPKTVFNAKEAQDKLAYGNSTIRGVAVAREKGAHYAPPGTVVWLFPVTDYLKEYFKLRDKYKMSLNYRPVLSEEAFKHRIETKVGANGEFVFERMKPGEYYIETYFDYTATGSAKKQVGSTDYYNVYGGYLYSSPIYQNYKYNYTASSLEQTRVKIKKDGEVKRVKL
ncbi:MAG: hypothetical protein Q4C98_02740 [Capnocytophaga sp.]|nr:hypothetical protein [Capnocytophaga sp.]